MFTLGRKIDIHYSTNRIIAIISLLMVVLGWIVTGKILSGLYIGGGTFLTWALAREVDPKHEYSAFLCVAFSFLNLFYYESIQILVILWIVLIIRLVNGITGKEITFLDVFLVLGMTIYLSINKKSSIYLVPFILSMVFVGILNQKKTLPLIAGGIGGIVFIIESFFIKYLIYNNTAYSETINIFIIAIIFISFVFWSFLSKKEVRDDIGKIVKRSKILSSQIIFSTIALLLYFFGDISLNNLIIYLSVITGVIIYWLGYGVYIRGRVRT